jgi:hypothetical protein
LSTHPSLRLSRGLKLAPPAGAIVAVLALGGAALTQEAPSKDEVFSATTAILLPNGQKIAAFDISFDDPGLTPPRYFLADRTNKQIVIVETDDNSLKTPIAPSGADAFAGTAACTNTPPPAGPNDCAGPDGVFTVNDGPKPEVWAGDGPTGTPKVSHVKVFQLDGTLVVPPISTGGNRRADEGCFDSRDHVTLWANDADVPSPFISFIATGGWPITSERYHVLSGSKITMDGGTGPGLHGPNATNGIEQCQWSPVTGKFYLNIPEINGPGDDTAPGAVLVIDPPTPTKNAKIEKVWMLDHDACAGPQGMAIGPNNQILLGCNAPSGLTSTGANNGKFRTVIINTQTGAIIAKLDNESGADEVWFNPGDGQYFLARSQAAGPAAMGHQLLGVVDANGHREDLSVFIAISGTRNAHSVAADPHKNQVYVPIPADIITATSETKVSTVCSSVTGKEADDDQGCIAVFTVTSGKDDHPRTVLERLPDDHQE